MGDKADAAKGPIQDAPFMLVRAIYGIVLGGLAGFGLYRYVGCADGTCLISSSPWGSVLYCMILGFVLSQARWPGRCRHGCPANHDVDDVESGEK